MLSFQRCSSKLQQTASHQPKQIIENFSVFGENGTRKGRVISPAKFFRRCVTLCRKREVTKQDGCRKVLLVLCGISQCSPVYIKLMNQSISLKLEMNSFKPVKSAFQRTKSTTTVNLCSFNPATSPRHLSLLWVANFDLAIFTANRAHGEQSLRFSAVEKSVKDSWIHLVHVHFLHQFDILQQMAFKGLWSIYLRWKLWKLRALSICQNWQARTFPS